MLKDLLMLTDLHCQNSADSIFFFLLFNKAFSLLYGRHSNFRNSSATETPKQLSDFLEFNRKTPEKYCIKSKFWLQTLTQDHYNLPEAFL